MKQKIIFALVVFTFLHSCKKDMPKSDCNNNPIPADTYKYPILPGTAAWIDLQTSDARWQACQIPDYLLPKMSTSGLVQSWLDMPLNNELYMTNSVQTATEWFIANFNGLEELVKRSDASDKLFEKFKSMDPGCVTSFLNDIEKGGFTSAFGYILMPLAQDTIINKMNLEQKKTLINEALKKYDAKTRYPNYYSAIDGDFELFVCAKVMNNCQYQPFLAVMNSNITWFIKYGIYPIPDGDYSFERRFIYSQSQNFVK